jgi:hypothetical protein
LDSSQGFINLSLFFFFIILNFMIPTNKLQLDSLNGGHLHHLIRCLNAAVKLLVVDNLRSIAWLVAYLVSLAKVDFWE